MTQLPNTQPLGRSADARGDSVNVLDVLILLARHKWLLLGLPFLVAMAAAAVSLYMTDVYTATTRVVLPQQSSSAGAALLGQLPLPGLSNTAMKSTADLYTGILQSRSVADELVRRFKLVERFGTKYFSDARGRLAGMSHFVAGRDGIITIEVDNEDPKFAADLANAYVDALIGLTNTLAVTEAGRRRVFLEQQLRQARADLAKTEISARSALQERGVAMVDEQGKSILSVVAGLRAQIAVKEVQIGSMGGFAAEQNPNVLQARQELAALKQQLAKLEGADGPRTGTAGRESVPGLKNVALLRDLKFSETVVEMLTKQYELAKVEEAKEAMVVQVLDPAVPPERKSKPARSLIVLASAFAAFVFSVVVVVVREALASARRNPQTSERLDDLRRSLRWRPLR